MKTITLRNGVKMPILGYGTLQMQNEQARACVLQALQVGYRLIDTAAAYLNEEGVGQAIIDSKLAREEVFITTKVWVQDAGYAQTMRAFETSLQKLQVTYIDLYLIHQPYGDYYGSWRALQELYQEKRVRVIGVCNFSAERLVDLCLSSKISPMINQMELHPMFIQADLLHIMQAYDCQVEAWGPLNEGQRNIFNQCILKEIAGRKHKTVAQVILRWHIQRNVIAIPKTIHIERMMENLDIWDFNLNEQDMKCISELDIGYSELINHQSYTTAKWLHAFKIHD